jgi:3-oxoacyl-[acyl-carrier protein] reductase
MVRLRRGRIISITSISGTLGNRGQTNYAAAKAGLIGATRSLALELAKRNITVNAIAPGLIDTDMLAGAPVDTLQKLVPMRRLGRPDEVASLVAYLASEQAGYITGQVITIAGGLG